MPRTYPSARERILDATERVILRDGPHAVSIDAVLLAAEVSKGGFFHHFATKDALLVALLERLSKQVAARANAAAERDQRGAGRTLRAKVALAFDMPEPERERTRALVLCLLAAVMESKRVAARARAENARELALAEAQGVDYGRALTVQLALDGLFLAHSFGTLKLTPRQRAALRATLLELTQTEKGGRKRG